ncbi:MAG TPA: cofactor-independent phosphoglycerate mutase [Coriobacteriia bacterium]|nr:cofactor-independent phosphoglycerate mutase [Coriobacteriia bacterium]
MKYVVVILDGAAGWPLDDLGGRTTLEAAATPCLDALAPASLVGLSQTVPEGAEPSSSAACTSIIGYDPVADYVGRGAIEAASMGIELAPDEVALRLNVVTTEAGTMKSYSSGMISTEESGAIISGVAEALDDAAFKLYPGVAYRHILVVKGHPELLELSYTPPHDIPGQPIEGHLPTGEGADLLLGYMERAKPILANSGVNRCRAAEGELPATDVWPFWPGVAPRGMMPFEQMRGVRGAMTSGVDLLNGLAVLAGIDRLHIAGVTGGPDTDYTAQIEGALAALSDHDLVVVHIESPDEEGHAGNTQGKLAAIEAIDREVISRVWRAAEEEFAEEGLRLLAMPDHPTPIALKTHVGEAVPFLLWGTGISGNGASAYNEKEAAGTGLLLDPGRQVMDKLLG